MPSRRPTTGTRRFGMADRSQDWYDRHNWHRISCSGVPMDLEGLLGFGVTFVLQSAVVLLASMFAFDVLHYFLHRWKKSRFRLLRRFARMHDVHHRFLTPRLKIDERYRWANLWCHVVPEFGTAVVTTLAFLLVFPWYPVAAILVVRLIMF